MSIWPFKTFIYLLNAWVYLSTEKTKVGCWCMQLFVSTFVCACFLAWVSWSCCEACISKTRTQKLTKYQRKEEGEKNEVQKQKQLQRITRPDTGPGEQQPLALPFLIVVCNNVVNGAVRLAPGASSRRPSSASCY